MPNIIRIIASNLKEDFIAQKNMDKENFKLVKENSKLMHNELKKPSPDFVEFREAKGLKAKFRTIGTQLKRNATAQRESSREKQRQLAINSIINMNKNIVR